MGGKHIRKCYSFLYFLSRLTQYFFIVHILHHILRNGHGVKHTNARLKKRGECAGGSRHIHLDCQVPNNRNIEKRELEGALSPFLLYDKKPDTQKSKKQ